MAVTPAEKYPVRSGGREGKIVAFSFTGEDGATALTTVVDPCNVISTAVRDGEGSYVFTLLTKYACVIPLGSPNVQSTTATDEANVDTVTDGTSSANSLSVTTYTAGAADDLDGIVVDVAFIGFAEE